MHMCTASEAADATQAPALLLTCQQSAVLLAGQGFHFDVTSASDTRANGCRCARAYAPRPHTVPHCAAADARDTSARVRLTCQQNACYWQVKQHGKRNSSSGT